MFVSVRRLRLRTWASAYLTVFNNRMLGPGQGGYPTVDQEVSEILCAEAGKKNLS
jgi:hypothetical protein